MLKRMKLYKYLPFSDGSLKILSEGTIKFSKPSEFNDPFDCAPDHQSENLEEFLEFRPDLVDTVLQFKKCSPEDADVEKIAMVKRLKSAIDNGAFGQKASDIVGICSLSRNPLNLLMWAHYADDHKGFVVEFDIPLESFYPIKDEVKYFEWLIPQKVEYQKAKPVVNFADDKNTKMKKQFLVKGIDWEYEQEERVIDYVRGSGIHKYDQDNILSSVFTGVRMGASEHHLLENIIGTLLKEKNLKIGIHKVAPVGGKFELHVSGRPDLKG
jgi:hypothetical protein